MSMAPGIWGKPSSTLDWCEENYAVTPYIAEFWNTLSSAMMIVAPVITICMLLKQKFEKKFIVCHLSLLSVGIGSWCFHMTLLYSMQLLDELPMIWGSAVVVYAFVEMKSPPNHTNIELMWGLLTFCVVVTVVYVICRAPIVFFVSYGVMVILVIFIAARTIRTLERSDTSLFKVGTISYALGFLLWIVDNNFCDSLRVMRDLLGVLSPVLELHAWWHVVAGFGTYIGLLFVTHSRCLVLKRRVRLRYWMSVWPYLQIEYTKQDRIKC